MQKKKKRKLVTRIAILYHHVPKTGTETLSKEHSITDSDTVGTVRLVSKVMKSLGLRIQIIRLEGEDLSPLKKITADYIFNLTDSREMEMKIAQVLDRLNIPYSGSPYPALLNSNNKVRSKALFEKMHIPTPACASVSLTTKITRQLVPTKFPVIVKPAYEHCSVGITDKSVAINFRQMRNAIKELRQTIRQTLLIEEYIKGREIQILVLERDNGTIALPPAEMKFRGRARSKWNIYGFTEKWDQRSFLYKHLYFSAPPKRIPQEILKAMQRDAIRAFYALGFRDYARFDLRYDQKTQQYYFLEGNGNPGLSNNPEDALMAALIAAEISFEEFLYGIVTNRLIVSVMKRRRKRRT